MLSILIPSRNEKYLQKTILDILKKAKGEIEVIAILDGYWSPASEIVDDKRVRYVHYSRARGMRNAINKGVEVAKGEYILKCDAHVMFNEGFDLVLIRDYEENTVVVPRRYALDPEKWEIIPNPKYPIDYMYLDINLHGVEWREKNKITDTLPKIDDLMSSQGSCWFMSRKYYKMLDILDEENYGTFFNEFQEIGFKVWLYQGKVRVNKNTWYAHWHKTESRGYSIQGGEQEKAQAYTKKWMDNTAWIAQQRRPLSWLIERFWPVPTWSEEYKNRALIDETLIFWRQWMKKGRGADHLKLRPLIPPIAKMIGDKKEVSIADIGSGPINAIGYTKEGVKVNYVPSDLLANEYHVLYDYHKVTPPVRPEYQDMTKLTYKDESFDIVVCRNALDHCEDIYLALKEMVRICKKGGYVYLWHFTDVGEMMGYTGMHTWNLSRTKDGDCLIWGKNKKFMLSEIGKFTNEIIKLRHDAIVSKFRK